MNADVSWGTLEENAHLGVAESGRLQQGLGAGLCGRKLGEAGDSLRKREADVKRTGAVF